MTLKLRWALIIGAFMLIGGASLIIGFSVAGFDILGWFSSKYAMYVYICVGLYLMVLCGIIVHDYVAR